MPRGVDLRRPRRTASLLPDPETLPFPACVIRTCQRCGLRTKCTAPVPGENVDPSVDVVLVGQNPGCFPAETLVSTPDGVRDIANLVVGDEVLGGNGQPQRVTALFSRRTDSLIHVKVHKMDRVTMTPNHPVFVLPVEPCYDGHTRRHCFPCSRPRCQQKRYPGYKPYWKRANQLKEGDHVLIPNLKSPSLDNVASILNCGILRIPFPQRTDFQRIRYKDTCSNARRLYRGFRLGRGLAYVLGWYMAEGHANVHSGIVQFSLGSGDGSFRLFLQQQCEKAFRMKGVWHEQGSTQPFCLYSRPLAAWFLDLFGLGARRKRVPPQIFRSDPRVIQSFVKGWYAGDGRHKRSGKNDGIVTASKEAAYGLRDLLLRLEVVPTLHRESWKGFAGDERVHGEGYCVEFPLTFKWERDTQTSVLFEGRRWLCVDSVETEVCSVPVYNIETEDNQFLIPFVVHNSNEDLQGRPFVGAAGQYLDSLLFQARIPRDGVAITNLVKCKTSGNRAPSVAEIATCSMWLDLEMDVIDPYIIVAMGAPATAHFLGPGAGTMEQLHGKPIWKDGRIILPTYHPAAALHDTAVLRQVSEDFHVLQGLIDGATWRSYHVNDEYPNPDYRVADSRTLEAKVLGEVAEAGEFSLDTEQCRGKLWSFQVSTRPGTAWFFPLGDNFEGRVDFSRWPGTAIVHYYLHDIQYVSLRDDTFVDTMVLAYLVGAPQGLKELAHRLCGIKMITYGEMVRPWQQELSLEYLHGALKHEWPDPPPSEETRWDNKKGEVITRARKPWHISRKIGKMLSDLEDAAGIDLWGRWRGIPAEERAVVEGILGPMPESSLADIPFDQAVAYACLSDESKVLMADGRYKDMGDLVREQSTEEVMSWHPTLGPLPRRIVGWYKMPAKSRVRWLSVCTTNGRPANNRWRNHGTRYTADHRLLTDRGWVAVADLRAGSDRVALPIKELTRIQRQVVLGSVLGDGCLGQRNKGGWSCLKLGHSGSQADYLAWKKRLLGSLCPSGLRYATYWSTTPARRERAERSFVSVDTVMHPTLDAIRRSAYRPNKRVSSWADSLDALGLTVFYMDDGTLVNGRSARLYVCGFDVESVDYLCALLESKWGVRSSKTLMSGRDGQYQVHILAPHDNFWSVVAPFVCPSMQYKLPERWRGRFTDPVDNESPSPVFSTVASVQDNPVPRTRRGSVRTKWCIDVEETHNFLTMGEVAHNCRDADATLRVYHKLQKMIEKLGLEFVQYMDLKILPMVHDMMRNGMAVDLEHYRRLSGDYDHRMRLKAAELAARVGHSFNPASPPQVATVVYGELGFAPTRLTATGLVSTDDAELKKTGSPIAEEIIRYRGLQKLKSTYADNLVFSARPDGNGVPRIHTVLKTTRVETGRLSSAKAEDGTGANLQNIPTRSKEARAIKNGFVAPPGWLLGEGDLCLIPDTRVLTEDWRWVSIESLKVGDKLVGISEDCRVCANGKNYKRVYTPTVVERVASRETGCWEIVLANGVKLTCSGEHPWLTRQPNYRGKVLQVNGKWSHTHSWGWVRTTDLSAGQQLSCFAVPWEEGKDWESGFLAGAFDGEGCLARSRGNTLSFAQNMNLLMLAVMAALDKQGFKYHPPHCRPDSGGFPGSKGATFQIWFSSSNEIARFLGTNRPPRLVDNSLGMLDGRAPRSTPVEIVSVRPVGQRRVISLQTSSHTFVAEGFFTHNCQIEMCTQAHLANCRGLIELFNRGGDPHTETAARLFNVSLEEAAKDKYRYPCKRAGFGIIYMIGPKGLSTQINEYIADLIMDGEPVEIEPWSEEACAQFIEEYYRLYPEIRKYQHAQLMLARRHGYVSDMFGRIRYIPEVSCPIRSIQEAGARMAANLAVTACLPADTRITTKNGWLPIGEFADGTEVWTGERWAAAKRLSMGVHPRVRLHLSDGRTFDCDTNHRLLVSNEPWPDWKNVLDILPDDVLVQDWSVDWGQPTGECEDWYWAGRFIGDGWLSGPTAKIRFWGMAFGSKEMQDGDRLMRWLSTKNIKGKTNSKLGYYPHYDRRGNFKIEGATGVGYALWQSLGMEQKKAKEKRIPGIVFTLDYRRRMAFLMGYTDADGRTSHRSWQICSASRGLLEDTVRLAETVGHSAWIRKPQTRTYDWPRKVGRGAVVTSTLWYCDVLKNRRELHVSRVELLPLEAMYTLSVDDERHAFASEGLISRNSAQGIIKLAMVKLWDELPQTDWFGKVRWLVQIHDSLLFELVDNSGVINGFLPWMGHIMSNVVHLRVPIGVDFKIGKRWGELAKYNG